jgi:UDP-glucose 4-epimerase
MRILVTGGSGLIGRYVVRDLREGHDVENLDIRIPEKREVLYHQVDLFDERALAKTIRDYDVVVHLAGIPHPLNDPPEKVFRTNAVGTFNVLEACAASKIPKVVFISSESVLGFAFSTTRMWPEYLQIDEHHPLLAQDPYGLSKITCEQLCAGFTRRTGMQTICLRPPWVWVPETAEIKMYAELRREYKKWYKNLWAYIHVFDVAAAIRKCVESTTLPAHDSFFICANETWVESDTRQLVADHYPETKKISPNLSGNFSLISCEKARSSFGFRPAHTWREIL